jgi:predicted ATPase
VLETLAIANYRSLRELYVPLRTLNVVTGANGSGKSSLYRALRLLGETAQGGIIGSLAREGGLSSALWAGPEEISRRMRSGEVPVEGARRKHRVRLRLGFSGPDLGYAIDLGLPPPERTAFALDPEIKRECVFAGPVLRPSALLVDRRGPVVRVRSQGGKWQDVSQGLPSYESVLTEIGDPIHCPEVLEVRERVRGWRFYDHLRTDPDAPARQPRIGTRTPVLSHDGHDLAAAIQTIREIGDRDALHEAVDDAFPGATLEVQAEAGRFELLFHQPGLLRPLGMAELSDGTLRYILSIAALLTPRPPELMVLNEPETSLHPDLLPALARLIGRAALHSQVWVVSHAGPLVEALAEHPECSLLRLEKELGETRVADRERFEGPAWAWPSL